MYIYIKNWDGLKEHILINDLSYLYYISIRLKLCDFFFTFFQMTSNFDSL